MHFIDRIVETDEFWELNYYMSSMKKAPHGGVEYVYMPNFFMKHRPTEIWCIEGANIDSKIWSALVSATLDMPFREFF